MADFSTWSALLTAIRNSLANRDLAVGSYRTPDGSQVEYRSFEELKQLEAWAIKKAAEASAASGVATRRTHSKPFSGGSW